MIGTRVKSSRMSRSAHDRNARRAVCARGGSAASSEPQEVLGGRRWRRANRRVLAEAAWSQAPLVQALDDILVVKVR